MKKNIFLMLMCVLAAAAGVVLAGCKAQGLTRKEVHRRHHDTVESNMLQVQDDIDAALLLDRPSRLSEQLVR